MQVAVLHTNDLHGRLDQSRFDRLLPVRETVDFYFDTGDCIKSGNLAVPVWPEAVWPLLAGLRCSASVIGNRETHVNEAAFKAKLAGAEHPVLCANLRKKSGERPLPGSMVMERNGAKVGVVGVSVPMVTEKMATSFASQFLWDPPIAMAAEMAAALRDDVDFLFALTHIGLAQDRKLAESCPHFDAILGGHSHNVIDPPERVAGTPIFQTGSHGRYYGRYVIEKGKNLINVALVPW